jgi:hypothetical protein
LSGEGRKSKGFWNYPEDKLYIIMAAIFEVLEFGFEKDNVMSSQIRQYEFKVKYSIPQNGYNVYLYPKLILLLKYPNGLGAFI